MMINTFHVLSVPSVWHAIRYGNDSSQFTLSEAFAELIDSMMDEKFFKSLHF
jgi:hypothetical protein